MAEGVQGGPERSRARCLRRQRTLDGEDRSVTIRQEGKGAVARDFWSCLGSSVLALRPNQACRHPSIRTLSERFIRSVQVGCSRFSRCCHLLVDLSSISNTEVGPGHRRSYRNSALGRGASNSTNLNYAAAGSTTGLLLRSGS